MSIATKCTCGYSIGGFCTSSIIECKNLIKPMSNNQLPADVQERIKADAEAYIKSYPDEGTEWAAYIAGATAEARHIAPMANALDQIAQAPVPANEREMLSWIETARALCDTTLQQWKGEGKDEQQRAKDGLMRLMLSGIEEVSKDAESAKAYLKEEGVEMGELEDNVKFVAWLVELSKLLHEAAAGQPVKINSTEARKWYDDGATPYQTFRETWNME